MKNLTRFLFFLFVTGIVFAQANNPVPSAPKISLETMEHNFGLIKDGVPVSVTFAIKNVGNADLKIEDVAPTCGCTTSEYDKVIAPGQTGKIVLILRPSGIGSFTKGAVITTNDPTKTDFKLTIKYESFIPKGYRVGAFIFDPRDEVMTELEAGKNYQAQIGFFYDGKESLKITDVKADKKEFDVRLETLAEGKRFKVIAQNTAPLAAGMHKQTVKLLTNSAAQPEVELSFIVNVGGGAKAAAVRSEKTVKAKAASRKTN